MWRFHQRAFKTLMNLEIALQEKKQFDRPGSRESVYLYWIGRGATRERQKQMAWSTWFFHDASMCDPPKKISLQKNCSCLEHDFLEALMMWNPSNPVHTPSGWDPTHSLKHSCRTLGSWARWTLTRYQSWHAASTDPKLVIFGQKVKLSQCMCLCVRCCGILWSATISGILTDSHP